MVVGKINASYIFFSVSVKNAYQNINKCDVFEPYHCHMYILFWYELELALSETSLSLSHFTVVR